MAVDNKIEWNFNNTYLSLPKIMLSEQKPDKVEKPEVIIIITRIWVSLYKNKFLIFSNKLKFISP